MAPLVGAARLPSRGRWRQGSVEPLVARAAGSRRGGEHAGWGTRGCRSSLRVWAHLPDRPWLNKLLRVISATPFGRAKGSRKDRRKPAETGRASRCPSEPGWQKGAPRRTLGSGNAPPPARPSAQHPSPVPLRLPPPPARAAGWERRRTGTWEVCGNFSFPGTTRAPGRSSWSREFESRGTRRWQSSLAVVRPVPKRLLE